MEKKSDIHKWLNFVDSQVFDVYRALRLLENGEHRIEFEEYIGFLAMLNNLQGLVDYAEKMKGCILMDNVHWRDLKILSKADGWDVIDTETNQVLFSGHSRTA